VITGCVSQIGDQNANAGRTSVLVAGFPEHVPPQPLTASAAPVSKRCTSPPKASCPAPTTSSWPAASRA
jgi:hypothetical protein